MERFPIHQHVLLILIFTFSAISYSLLCQGKTTFISTKLYLLATLNTLCIFFILRVSDEYKDHEDDVLYRKYLPVPRGLILLKELAWVACGFYGIVFILNIFIFPKILLIHIPILLYMYLMMKEFYIPKWLKSHQFWYVVSHMFIIPFVDILASAFNWFHQGENAPLGLIFFFIVSFLNGIVLEIGRKIKPKDLEEDGVVSYTKLLGEKKAPIYWMVILFATLCAAVLAAHYAHHEVSTYYSLCIVFVICCVPAIIFIKKPSKKTAKYIEIAAAIWTLAMYLLLGGWPLIKNFLL